ncbi:leucine--tRNA ligase [Candidatus Avelusimicrobium caledoniensis]|uniref:leucine--tRNA ligase n=1 Tax=Candidatus Avelusimicrobium caledoniensis TaxID=3416220 RepID=UPI003D141D96
MSNDNFPQIDKKQQDRWEKANLFASPKMPSGKKFYCLDMFPYPSGAGLHVGHPEGYTASDILTRYKRMNGYDVLHPMGWDAFGLPAENYAIATGVHPRVTTQKNIDNFRRQIKSIGLAYDWSREVDTTDPNYYKWTQWIFLQLFKKGLAYESTVPINWCPSCKTGLANEEVFNGKCERCGHEIERRALRQWILKITDYAEQLLEGLDDLDWPESTLTMQKNWIGKSNGANVHFKVDGHDDILTVYTTRPDTLFGATYMVVSPEHPILEKIVTPAQKDAVAAYQKEAAKKSDLERGELNKEKTGVFTGAYAINPVNGKKIPVWTSDYVLMGYGTGAIMAVPAHDERDYAFAKKFGIDIIEVIKSEQGVEKEAFTGDGELVNSGFLNGLHVKESKAAMIKWLTEHNCGNAKTTYKLRDWVFARQRYWGEPIPVVHCEKCGVVPLPESELPLRLPEVEKFEPSGTGESPLATVTEWVNTTCPHCGGPAKRETNTMPQWAGSCWYYLRYMDPHNAEKLVDPAVEKAYGPVDCYIGGAEHAVLHLLYARFWHRVLYDLGVVSCKEPFKKLRHQGMILAFSYRDKMGNYHSYDEIDFKDGKAFLAATGEELSPMVEKMSKSKKNVVNPDDILNQYGADAFRMYEMFMGPFEASKPWDMKGIEGVSRFLKRVYGWSETVKLTDEQDPKKSEILKNKTIEKVSDDIENFRFNTAVSSLMVLFNDISKLPQVSRATFEVFLKLLHPFAPHITDEIWQQHGHNDFLLQTAWPVADKNFLQEDSVELGVQINGKVRDRISVATTATREEIEKAALASAKVQRSLEGFEIKKIIVVPGRMVSIVAAPKK